jgi:hypothetical protein
VRSHSLTQTFDDAVLRGTPDPMVTSVMTLGAHPQGVAPGTPQEVAPNLCAAFASRCSPASTFSFIAGEDTAQDLSSACGTDDGFRRSRADNAQQRSIGYRRTGRPWPELVLKMFRLWSLTLT